ncbi:MAG: type II toxin-antitoxin system RelE/ParE family toxin [Bacteroidales bacterium]|nr:type II toxin-antitoxin system RelE/ParE family toxin [Bacteroidales bacterium]
MKVCYKTKKLAVLAANEKKQVKEMGALCAKIFAKRLMTMHAAENMKELILMPGRFHELKGERAGQWACDLEHPLRLIFCPQKEGAAVREIENADTIEIIELMIMEICDYH